MIEPCCDDQEYDPHDWGECMLIGTGQPGRDRAAYLNRLKHDPASTEPGPAHPPDA